MMILSLLGSVAGLATVPGTVELSLLTAGAILPSRSPHVATRRVRKIAVVIPAHNEKESISACVASLTNVEPPDSEYQVVVIADNCTDNTAELAAKAGATVWERSDAANRGKGYALELAFGKLLEDPLVDAALVVDADTVVHPNFVRACETMFSSGADAVQCRYLVKNPEESQRARLMNTALLAFNVLRPRGRDRFGLSVGILGNGWGLSRDTLERVPYNAHSVVEDLEYHIRLVREGLRVRFVDDTTVYGEMPSDSAAASTQRSRWEGGRFRMIREQVPGLVLDVLSGRLRSIEPAAELLLLPLAYHVGALVVTLMVPFPPTQLYALTGLGVVAGHIGAALMVGGGTREDLKALIGAPGYVLWKAGLLRTIFGASRKDQDWVRTARESSTQD